MLLSMKTQETEGLRVEVPFSPYLMLLFMNRQLITRPGCGIEARRGSGNYWFHLVVMVPKNTQPGNGKEGIREEMGDIGRRGSQVDGGSKI